MTTDPDFDLRTSKRLWVIAAVTAVGLHLGGAALALTNLRGDDGDEGLGADRRGIRRRACLSGCAR